MAEFTIPPGTVATLYDGITGAFIGTQTFFTGAFLTDNNTSDTSFVFGEPLLFTIGSGPAVSATYSGVAENVFGTTRVISTSGASPTVFVLNRDLDSALFPDVASLGINNSIDWTGLVCFAEGTRIATPHGWTEVQDLQSGDPVLTADGRAVPVLWLGRQTVMPAFNAPGRLAMVRIAAGALGDELPARDLVVTADHALCLDGLLVTAGALVGAAGVSALPRKALGDLFTVYHVETQDHDLILAEGVPAETFIDYVGRRAFDNFHDFESHFPEGRDLPEMDRPRISAARHLTPALVERLGLRRRA